MNYPYPLQDDIERLAECEGWSEEVYRDFFKLRQGEMSEADFGTKYQYERAIVSMDMTGFTSTAMNRGELLSLLRIVDAQRVVVPVLNDFGAELIRCFADDIVALFHDPSVALEAAFEIHRRIQIFNGSSLATEYPTQCCIGIGYGLVYAIGPNLAQGDEMNRSSKLGEDIARANETLITESAYAAIADRNSASFELQDQDDLLFPFYRATSV
jgi:adenylate cyclase